MNGKTRSRRSPTALPVLPPLLTVSEAARALRLSPNTVRRRVDDGTLPGLRVGGVRRILLAELRSLLVQGPLA